MNWKSFLSGVALVFFLGVGFVFLSPPQPAKVKLSYVGANGICVSTDKLQPEIWKRRVWNANRPQFVRWWVENKPRYYWEIQYSSAKGSGDFLGPVGDLTCQKRQTNTGVAVNTQAGKDASWVYKILIYECNEVTENGKKKLEKGAYLCTEDPVIWIRQ